MNIFNKHPNSVGESYFEHFKKAWSFGIRSLTISFRAFTHAFFPFLYEHGTSDKISELHEELQQRKRDSEES